jgi:hypothetical protein
MLGVVGAVLVVTLSLAFAIVLPPAIINGWVGLVLTAMVPTLIVQTTVWRNPFAAAAHLAQPLRGLVGLLVTMALGAAISVAAILGFGGGEARPTPFVIMPLVSAVPIVLWQVFLFECWPFSRLAQSPIGVGLLTLTANYVAVAVAVRLFFNDAFLRGAVFYDARLDPSGLFDAPDVVATLVGSAGGVLALVALDFWPVTMLARRAPIMKTQPWRGIAGLAFALGGAITLWAAYVPWSGVDVSVFQARACVSFIFGMFVLLVMLRGSAFAGRRQPLKGLLVIGVAVLIAIAAYRLYLLAAAWRGGLASDTELETWISTAMLAITFPGMSILADLFDFWPLRRRR